MKTALLVLAALMTTTPPLVQDPQRRPSFHIDFVLYGTSDLWRHADAVVYLRIEDTKPWTVGRIAEFGGLSVLHTARVVEVAKAHPIGGPTGQTVTFVQAGSTDEPAYAKGEEFIAFMNWSGDVFVRSAGPSSVYAVKQGKVDWLNLGRDIPYSTETLTVEDFIARLRAPAKQQR